MKKVGLLFWILVVATGLVFAGGSGDDGTIVLSMGTSENPGHPVYAAYEKFGEELERVSGGQMKLEIYPSSQLGDYRARMEQIQVGDLDMSSVGYTDMSYLIPEYLLVGQPYVMRDYDHLLKIQNSDYGKEMDAKLAELNFVSLDVWYLGARNTTSSRPLNSIEDFKGLKLRVPNVETLISFAQAAGAIPSPVAFSELYLALQTGQVEAQENPLPTIYSEKLYEIQEYIAMTQHYIAGIQMFINKEKYDSFTDEQKDWMNTAMIAGRELCNASVFQQEKDLIAEFEKLGITITYPDLEPFREAMKPYYAEVEKKLGAEGVIAEIMAVK